MTTKEKNATDSTIKPNKNCFEVTKKPDESRADAVAHALTKPEAQAAMTIFQWQSDHDITALFKELSLQVSEVDKGNMTRPEAMLISQAHTLDILFNNLAQKALGQTHMPNYESFLRLALKAQGQCRTTLETLAAIKNPPVIFAKQANISNNQQINNGVPAPSHVEKIKNQQNELLTELSYETLDSGRTSTTIEVNQAMATLE